MKSAIYYVSDKKNHVDVNIDSIENLDIPLKVNCASCCNTLVQHMNQNILGRQDYYLLYLIEGNFDVTTKKGRALVEANEMIVIEPKQPYRIICSGKNIYFLCVHFTGYNASALLKENNIDCFPKKNRLNPVNHLAPHFKTLFEAFAKNDEFRQKELTLLLERLLIEAGRAKKSYISTEKPLSKSILYINENYTEEIKIPQLAQMEAMCLTAYNKRFKEQIGTTPTKYIMSKRMQMAIEILDTTSLQIKAISSMCGYSNFNFFARVFRSFYGISPSEYRKSK